MDQQPRYSPDGLWWDGQQWVPTRRAPQPWRMTPLRWAWIVWCCLWGIVWLLFFWPMSFFSFALIALIAVRTKRDYWGPPPGSPDS
jgi:hypothetical protein